uniref:Uncharacterized protein n=1 Tax=Arcella intermedia TaxID=1963864 RepID=A0A6B2LSB0_9EUKA
MFCSSEALFRPSLVGSEAPGVHEFLYRALSEVDIDWRRQLLFGLRLCGGTTCLPGFPERLQREMALLAPDVCEVHVIASPEREYSVWVGGSILASLSTFQHMWISKEEYDESGPAITIRRPW